MLSNHTQDWIPRREGSAAGIDLSPAHRAPTILDVEAACALAEEDFDSYRSLAPEMRAMFLDAIADAILELGPHLVSLAALETGLSRARLEGERARIVSQLRMYAGVLRDGHCFTVEPTAAAAQLEMRMRKIALGPVAVFCSGDSFSVFAVAGADTASALAAGCPVIVHACSAQARTAGLLGGAIRNAMRACGIAQGVFSMLQGDGRRLGQFLAVQPAIKAIAFTGQRRHVQTLMQTIATRAEPIPLYAEVNSVNPVFLLPGALGEAAVSLARCFADSLIQGTGQFCPTPGLLLALEGPALQRFADAAAAYIAGKPASMVLSPAALKRYNESIQHLSAVKGVGILVKGMPAMPGISAQPALLSCDAATYMANPELQDEMVGPSALLVRCRDARELCQLAAQLSGQMTATLHAADGDAALAASLLPILERKAGRIVFSGFPDDAGQARVVAHAGSAASQGAVALDRFLRTVCYQHAQPGMAASGIGGALHFISSHVVSLTHACHATDNRSNQSQ